MLQLYRHNHLKGFMQATNNTKPQCSSHIIIMLTYVKTVTYFPPFGAIFSTSSTPPFFAHTPLTFLAQRKEANHPEPSLDRSMSLQFIMLEEGGVPSGHTT